MSWQAREAGQGRFGRLASYGIGDYGLNIYWNALSIWLVFWYTDVVGLKPETAGLLFLIAMAWDAISDPIVAGLSERVRTRHGTYRPFLLYGSIGLGASFCLLFWIPPLEGTALIVALVAIGIIFRTAYTLVAIPYAAMSSRLTYDSLERTELSGMRMFFAFGGLLTVSLLTPPLARAFSNGPQYTGSGFLAVAALGALVATAAILACFFTTRERPVPGNIGGTPRRPMEIWNSFLGNRALLILLVLIFLQSGATAALMISLVYFVEANRHLFAAKEVVLTAFSVATMLGVPVWTLYIRAVGKKLAWCVCSIAIALCGLQMLLFGPYVLAGAPVQVVAFGFFLAAFPVLFWSFIPDTVEYGQLRSGRRSEGVVFGSVLVVQKLSGGLMGVVVTQVLAAIGYQSGALVQGEDVGRGLIVFLAVCPAVMFVLSMIPVCLLPLDRDTHARIVGKLAEGTAPGIQKEPLLGKDV